MIQRIFFTTPIDELRVQIFETELVVTTPSGDRLTSITFDEPNPRIEVTLLDSTTIQLRFGPPPTPEATQLRLFDPTQDWRDSASRPPFTTLLPPLP